VEAQFFPKNIGHGTISAAAETQFWNACAFQPEIGPGHGCAGGAHGDVNFDLRDGKDN
jgi:hypothetical protein